MKKACSWLPQNGESLPKILPFHRPWESRFTPTGNRSNGPQTKDFFRLFMVPGMFHCRGGIGVDHLDALTALMSWVEAGKAPDAITATRVESDKVTRSRPLCPYPQVAHFSGTGNSDDAANFACQAPE